MKNLVLLLTLLVFASGAFAQEKQRKTITTDDLYEYFDEEDFVPNEILGASFTEFILKGTFTFSYYETSEGKRVYDGPFSLKATSNNVRVYWEGWGYKQEEVEATGTFVDGRLDGKYESKLNLVFEGDDKNKLYYSFIISVNFANGFAEGKWDYEENSRGELVGYCHATFSDGKVIDDYSLKLHDYQHNGNEYKLKFTKDGKLLYYEDDHDVYIYENGVSIPNKADSRCYDATKKYIAGQITIDELNELGFVVSSGSFYFKCPMTRYMLLSSKFLRPAWGFKNEIFSRTDFACFIEGIGVGDFMTPSQVKDEINRINSSKNNSELYDATNYYRLKDLYNRDKVKVESAVAKKREEFSNNAYRILSSKLASYTNVNDFRDYVNGHLYTSNEYKELTEEKKSALDSLVDSDWKRLCANLSSVAVKKAFDKMVLISKNKKIEKKGAVVIENDFQKKPSDWAVFDNDAPSKNMCESLVEFCPIARYEIKDWEYLEKTREIKFTCEFVKKCGKEGEKKYSIDIITKKDCKHVSLNSFDFSKAIEIK